MFSPIAGIRQTAVFRLFSLLITFVLITGLVMPPAQAAMLSGLLPQPGQILALSASYRPAILRGITINPDNPFLFDFLLQRGDTRLQGAELKTESEKLIKYFLTALTVPEDQGWVNLSPYEKDKIIGDSLSATQMGRTMLEQDYTLKQLSASLTYPETPLGQTFWTRVQDMAFKQFGTRDIPIDNFNKVWIVPERAVVTEEGATAFVVDWHLKVMMEADYQALKNDQAAAAALTGAADDPQAAAGQELSARFVREIVIPQLEKEVNEGTHFAPIRQVFLSVILATWFKQRLRESLLGKIYVDQGKTAGVDTEDPANKELIYAQYLAAFKQGVYNLVREDYDTDAQTMIPRKYFSGGVKITSLSTPLKIVPVEGIASSSIQHPGRSDDYTLVTVLTEESQPAAAAGIAAPSSPVVVPVTTTSLPGVGAESGTTKNVKFNGRSFPAGEFAIALHNMIDAVKMVRVNPIDEPGKVRWMISLFSYKDGGPAVPAVVSALGELLAEHHAALGLGLVTGKSLEDASLLHVGLEIKSRAVVFPGFWLWFLKNDDVLWFLRRLQYVMHKQLKDLSNIDSSATLDLLSASELEHPGYHLDIEWRSSESVLVRMWAPDVDATIFRFGEMGLPELEAARSMMREALDPSDPGNIRRFANKFEAIGASLSVGMGETILINGHEISRRAAARVAWQMQKDMDLLVGADGARDKNRLVLGLVQPEGKENNWTEEELSIADHLLDEWAHDLGLERVTVSQGLDQPSSAQSKDARLFFGLGVKQTGLDRIAAALDKRTQLRLQQAQDKIGTDLEKLLNPGADALSSPIQRETTATVDEILINGKRFFVLDALATIRELRAAARIVKVTLDEGQGPATLISLSPTQPSAALANPEVVEAIMGQLAQDTELERGSGVESNSTQRIYNRTRQSGLRLPEFSPRDEAVVRHRVSQQSLGQTRKALDALAAQAQQAVIATINRGWQAPVKEFSDYLILTGPTSEMTHPAAPLLVVMQAPEISADPDQPAEPKFRQGFMRPEEIVATFRLLRDAAAATRVGPTRDRFKNKFEDVMHSLAGVDVESPDIEINGQSFPARSVFRVLSQLERDAELSQDGIPPQLDKYSVAVRLVHPVSFQNHWTREELRIADQLLTKWSQDLGMDRVSFRQELTSRGRAPEVWGLGAAPTLPSDPSAPAVARLIFMDKIDDKIGEILNQFHRSQSSPVAATGDSAVAESGMIQQQPAGQAGVDRSGMEEIHWVIDQMKRDLQVVKLPVTDSAGIEKEYSAIGLRRPFGPEPDWTPGRLVRAWKYMDKWEEEFGLRLAPVPQYHGDPSDKILLSERWIWGLIGDKNRLPAVMEEIIQRLTSYANKLDTFLASEEGAKIDADLAALMKSFDDSFPSVKVGSSPIAAGEPQLTDARDQVMGYVRQVEEIIADTITDGYLEKVPEIKRRAKTDLRGAYGRSFDKISVGLLGWRWLLSQIENPDSTALRTKVIADRFTAIRAAFSAEERLLTGLADERERLVEKWQERMAMLTAALDGVSTERAELAKVIGEHVISFQQELARARAALSAASSSPMGATGAAAVDPGASLQWQELLSDLIEESWGMLSKTEGRFASLQNVNAHAIRGVDLAMTGAFRRVTEGLVVGIRMRRNVIADVVPDPGSIKNDFVNIYDSFLAEQRFIQDPTLRQLSLAKWAELMSQLDEAADNLPSEQSLAAQAIREQIAAFQAELDRARNVTEPQTLAEAIIVDQQQPAFLPESQPLSSPAAPGGIDLDPRNMDLQIRRDAHGVPLPLPMQDLEQIHIDGLYPVILNIAPANLQGLPFLLGLLADQDPPLLAREVTGQEG